MLKFSGRVPTVVSGVWEARVYSLSYSDPLYLLIQELDLGNRAEDRVVVQEATEKVKVATVHRTAIGFTVIYEYTNHS
jgi:hypothetical protein